MELQRKRILLQCRLSAGRKLNNTRMQSVAEGSSSVATGEPPRLPISGNCRCAMACVLITHRDDADIPVSVCRRL